MNTNENKKRFNEEIDRRIGDSDWSASVAAGVVAAVRSERKKKVFDITSVMFPVAAAAVLVLVLTFQTGVRQSGVTAVRGAESGLQYISGDVSGVFSDEVDQLIGYNYTGSSSVRAR